MSILTSTSSTGPGPHEIDSNNVTGPTRHPSVALVIGGSSEIGAALCRRLSRRSVAVAVHYHRRAEAAAAVVEAIEFESGRAVAMAADVTDPAAVAQLVAGVNATLGPIDVLVYAAANVRFSRFLESSPDEWAPQINVTLLGFLISAQPIVRAMVDEGWGRVVAITAEGAITGEPALAVASAAKAGLVGFTRSLAREVAPFGVTVNAVSPGFIPTSAVPERLRQGDRLKKITRAYPAGRLGTPDDVAAAVDFLCSADSGYVTGQVISVSGGYGIP
jgi:NAD(P)-dependent dehydrogenase (short-subunit alcohol dehydrogenase family)